MVFSLGVFQKKNQCSLQTLFDLSESQGHNKSSFEVDTKLAWFKCVALSYFEVIQMWNLEEPWAELTLGRGRAFLKRELKKEGEN